MKEKYMKSRDVLMMFRYLLCVLFLAIVGNNYMYAQITIGTHEPPVSGALVQFKSDENKVGDVANTTKGLGLPRVYLVDLNMLYPMFEVGYDKNAQDRLHTGLMVYNTNEGLNEGKGIYVWNGEYWSSVTASGKQMSLDLNTDHLVLWKNLERDIALLTMKSAGLAWKYTSSEAVGSSKLESVTNGLTSTLTFNRSTTVFGDEIFTFSLVERPDITAKIKVSNLEVVLSKPILRVGTGNVNGSVNSSSAVIAYGGSAQWEVVDWEDNALNWTIKPSNTNGRLQFELGPVKKAGSTQGAIRVRHLDQPGLIKTLVVEQNADYKILPPFDYLVMEYGYVTKPSIGDVDIDSATEILKTNVSGIDNKPVGYNISKELIKDGSKLLIYPGDDMKSGSENVYADIPTLNKVLNNYPNSSTQIEFGMSAWWFLYGEESNTTSPKPATVTIKVYKGGTMVKDPKNDRRFINVLNGIEQAPVLSFKSDPKSLKVRRFDFDPGGSEATYRELYTPMYKLEYDRIDNTGVLIPWKSFND